MVRRSVRYAWTAAVSLAAGGGIVTMSRKGAGNARSEGATAEGAEVGRWGRRPVSGTGPGGFQTRPYGIEVGRDGLSVVVATTGVGRWHGAFTPSS